MPNGLMLNGSGTPRPKTISTQDSSAQTFRPIFQSGTATARPIYFFCGGGGAVYCFILFMCVKTIFNVILIFRQGNREII